ncbi:MAG: Hsp70 family protein, partial [Anaerolineales bacterium]|nr:Hsp70 family protein [Anaerolineales bacterium]
RPVRFAFEPEKDKLAQARLLDAAFRAGYERVYFQYEPIAAAYSYAADLTQPETILVFDFGGGTLDVTIMRLGDNLHQREILATGGIPVAGDSFDRKLVRAKLPRHFGEGSYYRTDHKRMPVPGWIYDIFADWQRILELQSPQNKLMLADIAAKAERPREIEALIGMVAENYTLQMFDAVEHAKRELSDKMGALVKLDGPQFHVRQLVTRTDFEAIIREDVLAVGAHLDEMLAQAGLTPADIDVVVRTG